MKVIPLNSTNESKFWSYVEHRKEEYFFFIMDLKNYPEYTKIWMAIDENGDIQGMLLDYKGKNIQIRGSDEAVKKLIGEIDLSLKDITILYSQKGLLDRKYLKDKKEIILNRMLIHPGENIIKSDISSEILTENDKEELASLYRKTDPSFWGHVQGKDLEFDENHKWFGIKRENKIVSFAHIWFGEEFGLISTVGTHPDFRNSGFATSLVSVAIQELLKHSPLGLIHVRADNAPAVHTYKKNGFRDFLQFYFLKSAQ